MYLKKQKGSATIYPILTVVFLLLSVLISVLLVKTNQDIRDLAITCELPKCESGGTCFNPGETSCNTQQCKRYTCDNGSWVNGVPDSSCGDCTQPAVCGNGRCEAGETCVNCETDCMACPADWCEGSCDRNGCTNSGTNCPSTGTAVCHGLVYGCNGNSSSYYASSYSFTEDFWCTSIQNDSNASNDAYSTVYIGDGGSWCYNYCNGNGRPDCQDANTYTCSDGLTNPSQLDWDCSTPTNTPTPTPIISNTPTPTRIVSNTPTLTPTKTPTPSPTKTPTPTVTNTPPPGSTSTPTPLASNTPTPTNTPAPGDTATPVPTSAIAQGPSPTRIVLPEAGVDFPAKGLFLSGAIIALFGLLILL